MSIRTAAVAVFVSTLVASPVLAQGQVATRQPDASWLSWDAATTTVKFHLIAGAPGAKSPFNFNGYTDGEFTLVVPENASVVMSFVNDDGVPHSAEIIRGDIPIPNSSGEPAIPRAYTRKAMEGMNQGETDDLRFKAAPAGNYRIFCGVPGHGVSGMWVGFEVRAGVAAPSMEVGPGKGTSGR
jgi:sulfocyanin